MNITVKSVLDISGAKETHVNSNFSIHFSPSFYNPTLFGVEFIQLILLFLAINEAALMLCATMNEIKHCASKCNYAFGIKLKRG